MKDTFESNLKTARTTERNAAEAHTDFMKGKNDDYIATKTEEKAGAENTLADDTNFLAQLRPMCAATQSQFEDRKMIRSSDEAAITQAISILNSNAGVESFGKVKATTEGGTGAAFLQVAARRHRHEQRSRAAKANR